MAREATCQTSLTSPFAYSVHVYFLTWKWRKYQQQQQIEKRVHSILEVLQESALNNDCESDPLEFDNTGNSWICAWGCVQEADVNFTGVLSSSISVKNTQLWFVY